MTDPHTPVSALGRAYMSGYTDGARDAATAAPRVDRETFASSNPNPYAAWPPPALRQVHSPLLDQINEWRRRAETAETALAEVRGQRDYAVTSLANVVDAAVKNSPDGTGSGWVDFPPALDTDGEPPLIADGTLAGAIRRLSGEPGGGFEVRVRFVPGDRTRVGTGYAYRITLPFGPDGTPPEVIDNG